VTPPIQRITVKRGDTLTMRFFWRDARTKAPLDVSGCAARLQVRGRDRARTLLAHASIEDGRLVHGPDPGELGLTLSAEVMRGIPPGEHLFDLELTWPDGRVQSSQDILLDLLEDQTQ
jgi:hypothetical protein